MHATAASHAKQSVTECNVTHLRAWVVVPCRRRGLTPEISHAGLKVYHVNGIAIKMFLEVKKRTLKAGAAQRARHDNAFLIDEPAVKFLENFKFLAVEADCFCVGAVFAESVCLFNESLVVEFAQNHWNWCLFKMDARGLAAFSRDRTGVFGEGASSLKLNLNDLKPYVALMLGRFESYLGWRERGNLGVSFRPAHLIDNPAGKRILLCCAVKGGYSAV